MTPKCFAPLKFLITPTFLTPPNYFYFLGWGGGVKKNPQSLHICIKDPCEQCDYQATDKSDLTQHYQSVHKGKYGFAQYEFQATHKLHLTTNYQALHMGIKYKFEKCEF